VPLQLGARIAVVLVGEKEAMYTFNELEECHPFACGYASAVDHDPASIMLSNSQNVDENSILDAMDSSFTSNVCEMPLAFLPSRNQLEKEQAETSEGPNRRCVRKMAAEGVYLN